MESLAKISQIARNVKIINVSAKETENGIVLFAIKIFESVNYLPDAFFI